MVSKNTRARSLASRPNDSREQGLRTEGRRTKPPMQTPTFVREAIPARTGYRGLTTSAMRTAANKGSPPTSASGEQTFAQAIASCAQLFLRGDKKILLGRHGWHFTLKCEKCSSLFIGPCAGLSSEGALPETWLCPVCKEALEDSEESCNSQRVSGSRSTPGSGGGPVTRQRAGYHAVETSNKAMGDQGDTHNTVRDDPTDPAHARTRLDVSSNTATSASGFSPTASAAASEPLTGGSTVTHTSGSPLCAKSSIRKSTRIRNRNKGAGSTVPRTVEPSACEKRARRTCEELHCDDGSVSACSRSPTGKRIKVALSEERSSRALLSAGEMKGAVDGKVRRR